MPQNNGPLRRLWCWIKDPIIQEVPNDIAVCAYDCRKGQCTMGEWKSCKNRLHKIVKAVVPPDDVDRDEKTKNGSFDP